MANVEELLLKVSVDGAQNIADLKSNIKELKDALGDESATAEENRQVLDALRENQNALKDAMYGTAQSAGDLVASTEGLLDANGNLSGSYNDLVHMLAELKGKWRETDDEAERGVLAEQINKVNDKLKDLDAGVGSYKRNVGNYTNSIVSAFQEMGGATTPVIGGIKKMDGAMKLMSTNPVMAVLGVLAAVLQKIIESLKSSEENMNAVTSAFSAFNVVGDMVNKLLQGIGAAVGWLANALVGLLDSIGLVSDGMKERQALQEKEIELAQKERENIVANAETERDIAKLKADAAEKDKHTTEERLALLQEAADKEKEIARRAYEEARLSYEIQRDTNALAASSAEEKKKEAEAYAEMIKAETDYYKKVKEVTSQVSEARKTMSKERQEAARAHRDAATQEIQAQADLIKQEAALTEKGTDEMLALQKQQREKEYEIAVVNAKTRITDKKSLNKTLALLEQAYLRDVEELERSHQKEVEAQQNLHMQNLMNSYGKGSTAYLSAMRDLRKQQLEQAQAGGKEQGETMEEYNARLLAARQAYQDSVRALNAKHIKDSTAELRLALSKEAGESQGYYEGMLLLARNAYDTLQREEGESDTEFLIRKQEAYKAVKEAQADMLNYMDEQERLRLENRMNEQQEGTLEFYQAEIDLKRWELETLAQMDSESDDAFYARKLAAEKSYMASKKRLAQQQIQIVQNAASATSNILGSLADVYEGDTEASEGQLKAAKNLRIAGATIDMLSGVVTAISQAQQLGPIAGPIMAAVNSAAVIAAGVANIQAIKNTSTSSNSASTGSATAASSVSASTYAPDVETQVQQVRQLTSASEEDRLNSMASDQRVVLVMSDLEQKQGQIRVQVEESSF